MEPSDLAIAEPLGCGKGTADRISGLDSGAAGRMSGSEASPFSIDGFCDNITVSGGDTSFVASDGTGVSWGRCQNMNTKRMATRRRKTGKRTRTSDAGNRMLRLISSTD